DRYNTTIRKRIASILESWLDGEAVEFTVRVSESNMARVHFVVRPPRGQSVPDVDQAALERRLVEASRSWEDDFSAAVVNEFGEESGARLSRAYVDSFPEGYKEDYPPAVGAVDLGRLEAINGDEGLDLNLHGQVDAAADESRLKVYRV